MIYLFNEYKMGMTAIFCMWGVRILQTDTASVLMEAIGYIKFLQNQVEVRSLPNILSSTLIFYLTVS